MGKKGSLQASGFSGRTIGKMLQARRFSSAKAPTGPGGAQKKGKK